MRCSIGEGFCNWILGSTQGQWTFLGGVALAQVLIGAAAWSFTGGDGEIDGSFTHSLWMSYTLFIDPGTQTGLSPDAWMQHKMVAVIASILGFIFNLAVLGLVVDLIRDRLARWKEERGRTSTSGHALLLGWGEKTIFMITELLAADMTDTRSASWRGHICCCSWRCRRRRHIVVLSERSYMDMKQEVNLLVRSRGVAGRLSFRTGDPTDPTDLMKVSANHAADILIMSAGSNNRKSDQKAIQTLLALAALPKQLDEGCDVFAEVQNSDTLPVVNPLLPNNAEGIVARDAVNQMLIIRALMPPVGYCFIELVSYHKQSVDKNSIYPLEVPEALVGVPFSDACRLFPHAVICGILPDQRKDGTFKTAVIPEKSAVLKQGEMLVVVATDTEKAEFWEPAPCRPERRPTLHSSVEDIFTSEGQLRLGPMGHGDVPSNVLMLGCPNDLASFLSFLDLYLPLGSHVHVLSPRSMESRESSLRRHSSMTSPGRTSRLWETSPFFRVDERPKSKEGDEPESILHHIRVTHHTGSPTEKMSLAKMPLTTAHVCLILAEHHAEDEDSAAIDSRNLTTLILIRNLLVECGRDDLKRSGMPDRCKVLIELMDPKSRRVVEGNDNVRKLGSFLYSSAVEIGMFAQAVREKSMYHFILQLLDPSCRTEHLVSYPVRYFVGKDDQLSYWDLHASIWNSSGGILLGWKRKGDRYPSLNPPDKTASLNWSARGDDQLLVLRPPNAQDNDMDVVADRRVVAETTSLPVSNTAAAVSSSLPHCVPPMASLAKPSVQ